MVVTMLAFALFNRSNGPFLNAHFTQTVAAAAPLPSLETLARLPRRDRALTNSIDVISEGATHLTLAGHRSLTFHYHGSASMNIDGWAIDQDARQTAAGVIACIDGRARNVARVGSQRPDVARAFSNPAYAASGFHLEIPVGSVPTGRHRLSFLIVDASRESVAVVDLNLRIDAQRKGPS